MNLVDTKYLIKYIEDSLVGKKFKLENADQKFINNIKNQIEDGIEHFSDKQRRWLEDIYRRTQNGGGHQFRNYV